MNGSHFLPSFGKVGILDLLRSLIALSQLAYICCIFNSYIYTARHFSALTNTHTHTHTHTSLMGNISDISFSSHGLALYKANGSIVEKSCTI